MIKQEIKVHNIKCGGCANSIQSSISSIEGVSQVEIDIEEGVVSFDADTEKEIDKVRTKLESMGYPEDDPTLVQSAKSYVSCMIGRLK